LPLKIIMSIFSEKSVSLFPFGALRVPRLVSRYGFALLVTLSALLLSRWIKPLVDYYLFDFFQGAVVLSAWYGGLGPGILTSTLSLLALDYFFMPPYHMFSVGITDLFRLTIFGAVAVLTSSLSDQLKQAKLELELAHEELEERIALRTLELTQANASLVGEVAHRLEAEEAILGISNREQRRLGQDLHDGLCQILAGVRLMSGELKEKLAARSISEVADAEIIETRLSEALAQADNISRGLYPVELETNGLMSALEEMTAKLSTVFPVICRFRCPRPVHVPDASVANHLYRIAQEAVVNAVKGGRAKHVTVRLFARANGITLSITDDGIGIGNHSARKGMGLKIMEYRARMINAALRFHSRRRGWTRVSGVLAYNSREGAVPYA